MRALVPAFSRSFSEFSVARPCMASLYLSSEAPPRCSFSPGQAAQAEPGAAESHRPLVHFSRPSDDVRLPSRPLPLFFPHSSNTVSPVPHCAKLSD